MFLSQLTSSKRRTFHFSELQGYSIEFDPIEVRSNLNTDEMFSADNSKCLQNRELRYWSLLDSLADLTSTLGRPNAGLINLAVSYILSCISNQILGKPLPLATFKKWDRT